MRCTFHCFHFYCGEIIPAERTNKSIGLCSVHTPCFAHIIRLINLRCSRHSVWISAKKCLFRSYAGAVAHFGCHAVGVGIIILIEFMNKYFWRIQIFGFMFAVDRAAVNKFANKMRPQNTIEYRVEGAQLKCEHSGSIGRVECIGNRLLLCSIETCVEKSLALQLPFDNNRIRIAKTVYNSSDARHWIDTKM